MKKSYCIFSAQYLPHMGGVERHTYNLAKKLAERGNKVTVVASNVDNAAVYENMEGIIVYRMPCFDLMNGRFPIPKLNSQFWKINRILLHKHYDLVIINTRFYFHSLYGMCVAKRKKISCITIEHGTGHLLTGNIIFDKIGEVYEHFLTMVEKRICGGFYGVSEEASNWLAHFNIEAKGVLYNSIDIEQIGRLYENPVEDYRKKYQISKDDVVITYAGRLVREKGILPLIQAVNELHQKYPEVHLFIAGDGELMQEVERKRKKFILPLGKLEFEQVVALLRQTDIFCLPTDYPEGFPTSTLEAMACRCYPVVTDRGGAHELIPDASYGCIMPNNQVTTLVTALEQAMSNQQRRMRAVAKGYQRVRELFTWESVADQIEDMCNYMGNIPEKADKGEM